MQFLVGLLLAGLTLLAASLQRTYHDVPTKELRRRARTGDQAAEALYRATVYGPSLRVILWILVVGAASLFFIYMARVTQSWLGPASVIIVLWLGFIWLPAQQATKIGVWFAVKIAPALAWLLNYIHPLVERIHRFIRRHRPIRVHTGLYDKYDLIELLERQQVQPDNRIDKGELEIALHALTFGQKQVGDILTPRRMVKMVAAEDTTGPILMSELHESGFSRFPVYDDKEDNIVGTLFLKDLVTAKESGQVRDIMKPGVSYVHEDETLYDALQALIKTRQHLFVVVNSFEEYVGILTMEDVLEQIIGKQIIDEFDQYHDLRAVAAKQAKKEHARH